MRAINASSLLVSVATLAGLLAVRVVYAAEPPAITAIKREIVNPILSLFIALGLIVFIWGVVGFMMNREDATKATEGKKHMIWGIVGLTVIVGVFGIINLIIGFLGTLA